MVSEDTGSISGSLGKKERYFWQYNVQAKGPKGQRVTINQQQRDPHSLPSIMDPVFSPLCSIQGIKHRCVFSHNNGGGSDMKMNYKPAKHCLQKKSDSDLTVKIS